MFSKSKSKRFHSPTSDGPAPGQYDVKDVKAKPPSISFIKDKRWKEGQKQGELGGGSAENLSFTHKPLVPIAQSTCLSKKSKRKSCFPVSTSATDLRSCRRLNLSRSMEDNLHQLTGEETDLKEQISKLQLEVESWKMLSEKTKMTNDELKATLDEILEEKLSTDLKNQSLMRNLKSLEEGVSSSTGEQECTIQSVIEEILVFFTQFEKAIIEKQNDYVTRLDQACQLLQKLKLDNQNKALNMGTLQVKYNELQAECEAFDVERNTKDKLVTDQEGKLKELQMDLAALREELQGKDLICNDLTSQLESETGERVKVDEAFAAEKEKILRQIEVLESVHDKELKEVRETLSVAHDLNTVYKEQIQNVELSMTDNIREMTQKYEVLEDTFCKAQKSFQERLQRSDALVHKMGDASRAKEEEFINLRNLYTELQGDYEQLFGDSETKDGVIEAMKAKASSQNDTILSMENQLSLIEKDKEEACNALACQVEELKRTVSEKELVIGQRENMLADMKVVVQTCENQSVSLKSQAHSLTCEVETLQGQMKMKENERYSLENQLQSLSEEKTSLQHQVEALEEKNRYFEGKAVSFDEEKKSLHNKIESLCEEKIAFQCKVRSLDEQARNLEGEVDRLDEERTSLQCKIRSLEDHSCSLENNVKLLEGEIRSLKSHIDSLDEERTSMQRKIRSLENNITSLEKGTTTLQDKILSLEEETRSLEGKLSSVSREKTSLQSIIEDQDQEQSSLQCKVKSLEDQTRVIEAKAESLVGERISLQNKVESLEDELQSHKEKLKSVSEEKTSLISAVNSLDSDKTELQGQVRSLEDEKVSTEGQIISLINEKTTLQSKVVTLEEETKCLGDKISSLNTEKSSLQSAIKSQVAQLEGEKRCLEDQMHAISGEKSTLQGKYEYTQEEKASLQLELKSLESQMRSLESEVESLNQDRTTLHGQVNSLTNEKATLQCQIESQQGHVGSLEEQIESLENQVKSLEQEVESVEASKEEAYNVLKQEIDDLTQDIMEKENHINQNENSARLLENQMDLAAKAHEDAIGILNEQTSQLKGDLEQQQIQHQAEVEHLQGEMMDMKLALEQSSGATQEEMDVLLAKLSDAEKEADSWKLRYEDLERKVGPFMEQLEQFEFEKQYLLNQNIASQQEMKKLSEKYGQILGHQNNKQKIKHISKLKEENLQLKSDMVKLRANADKDRIKIRQLETAAQGKRFDPSKSFSHGNNKENRDALRTVNQ